jgi:predicted metal-dependent phosphotriesterase family hydrolase
MSNDRLADRLPGLVALKPGSFVSIHEHVQIDLRHDAYIGNNYLLDPDLAVDELTMFASVGGDVIVDQTPYGLGVARREVQRICDLARVQVVFGCGWYRGPYHDDRVVRMSADSLAEVIVLDLLEGDEDGICPGLIGEVGSHNAWILPAEERVLRAAARAHHVTGAAIATHVPNPSALGLDQLKILCDEEGVAPERVIIGHGSGYTDTTYHLAVVDRGAFISFDRMGVTTPHVVRSTARTIRAIAEAGGVDRILLGQDVCYKSDLVAFGGSGYAALGRHPTADTLDSWGLNRDQYTSIMTRNPWRALTGTETK